MPLVHVEGLELAVTERLEHRRSADTEQRFLAEAVALIAAVQVAGESAVLRVVVGQVRVEEVDGNRIAAGASDRVEPRLQADAASFDTDLDLDVADATPCGAQAASSRRFRSACRPRSGVA